MDQNRRSFLAKVGLGGLSAATKATGAASPSAEPAEDNANAPDAMKHRLGQIRDAWDIIVRGDHGFREWVIDNLSSPSHMAFEEGNHISYSARITQHRHAETQDLASLREKIRQYNADFRTNLTQNAVFQNGNHQPLAEADLSPLVPESHLEKFLQEAKILDNIAKRIPTLLQHAQNAGYEEWEAQAMVAKALHGHDDPPRLDEPGHSAFLQGRLDEIHRKGPELVDQQIRQRRAEEEKKAPQRKYAEEVGKIFEPRDDRKYFLPLSCDEKAANTKLSTLAELLEWDKIRLSFSDDLEKDTLVLKYDIRVKDLEPKFWPEDRYVNVPTESYQRVYGAELSAEQARQIEKFLINCPNITQQLGLTDFLPAPPEHQR